MSSILSCTEQERGALREYGLEMEHVDGDMWDLYIKHGRTEDGLGRLVRVTAVNRMMARHGLEPLLQRPGNQGACACPGVAVTPLRTAAAAPPLPPPAKKPKKEPLPPLDPAEAALAADINISPEEFDAIRGDYGAVCGLRVDKATFMSVLNSTNGWRKKHPEALEQSRSFAARKLKSRATTLVRRVARLARAAAAVSPAPSTGSAHIKEDMGEGGCADELESPQQSPQQLVCPRLT